MIKKIIFLGFVFLICSVTGFGYGAPGVYTPSDTKEYFISAQTLRSLQQAYNGKNLEGFMELTSLSGDEKQRIKNSLVSAFTMQEGRQLEFYVIEHSQFFNRVTVLAEWDIRSTEIKNKIYKSGKTKFNFKVKEFSAKLVSIKGESPF